jgi:hypothetical protein
MVDALQRLYRGRDPEDIRKALARIPLVLTRSLTEEQVRKVRDFLEAKGAILEIAYEAPTQPRPEARPPGEAPPPSPPGSGGPARERPPALRATGHPAQAPAAVPIPSGMLGPRPEVERRAKPRVHPGIQLQPMGVSEILDRSFRLLRERFWLYLIIMVIPLGIISVGSIVLAVLFGGVGLLAFDHAGMPPVGAMIGIGVAAVVLLFVFICIQAWAQGALIHAVSETYLGHDMGVRSAYKAVSPALWSLLWAISLMGILAILATGGAFVIGFLLVSLAELLDFLPFTILMWVAAILLFPLPGSLLVLNWLMADKVVVLEGMRGWQALKRSWELMSSRTEPGFWRGPKMKASILLLVGFAISMGILMFFQLPKVIVDVIWPGGYLLQTILQILYIIGNALATAFFAVSMILYYYDIRLRKEGFDLKMMAESL